MYEDLIGAQRAAHAQMGAHVDYGNGRVEFEPGNLVAYQGQGLAPSAEQEWASFDALNIRQVQQPQMGIRARTGLRFQRQWYGFPRTKICAGETVRINAQAQVLMKIIRLFLGDDVNGQLLVHELTIAKNNLINGDAIIGALFSPLAQDAYPQTATETIQPGCSASIVLENVGETTVCVSVSASVGLAW